MVKNKPNIHPDARLELKEAAAVMQVQKGTILRWTNSGKLKCSIRRANNRRVWSGKDLISFWRANV